MRAAHVPGSQATVTVLRNWNGLRARSLVSLLASLDPRRLPQYLLESCSILVLCAAYYVTIAKLCLTDLTICWVLKHKFHSEKLIAYATNLVFRTRMRSHSEYDQVRTPTC
jgi:hypothetical protein